MLPEPQAFHAVIDGKAVVLYSLENQAGMKIAITNYGGRIASWLVPDRDGNLADIVLGYDNIAGYLESNEVYFGALIGRYGNRIAKGQFTLGGETYQLTVNNGENHLHGGTKGFHNVVWDAEQADETHLTLRYQSPDGEEGYPGNLSVKVDFHLTEDNELQIDYTATADQRTVVNLTTHPFFNLAGAGAGTINDHVLMIAADRYTPVDAGLIPTGEILPVAGTPFDFRSPTPIGDNLGKDTANVQLKNGLGFDHNFVLGDAPADNARLAARVSDPKSGRVLEVFTTEPGLQFYGGNFLDGSDRGRGSKPYHYRTAFCLEPQHFPDSPNQPAFPSTVLERGQTYRSTTIFKLSAE